MKKGEQARGKQWYYRGCLKSCNYACGYCPFSKKPASPQEMELDERQLVRFVDTLCGMGRNNRQKCAVQIVPYGEALIHEYYWRELARLSRQEHIELAGAQTNGSFHVGHMLSLYRRQGGDVKKLRLWCTFHPTMTTREEFLRQCQILSEHGVSFCVGTVGAPEHREDIRWLREHLPAEVYLWVNRYDGLKRAYREEEILAFLETDPFFFLELAHPKTDVLDCGESIFVEGDGSCKRCNIDRGKTWNLYTGMTQTDISCHRKYCSCYLAYCNRPLGALKMFGKYPAFRIPSFPRAFFLDVDGTLAPRGKTRVPERTQAILRGLHRFSRLFLATSLPRVDAAHKTRDIARILSGGVYAGGGRCVIHDGAVPGIAGADKVFALACDGGEEMGSSPRLVQTPHNTRAEVQKQIEGLKRNQKALHYRLHVYERRGEVYKITLVFAGNGWKEMRGRYMEAEAAGHVEQFYRDIKAELGIAVDCSVWYEEGCLQILAPGVCKLSGVKYLCEKAGFAREDVIAYGDGKADAQMMEYYNSITRR